MRSRLFSLFLFVLVCSISAAAQTVVESASSVSIVSKTANVKIAVSTDKDLSSIPANIELIDPESICQTYLMLRMSIALLGFLVVGREDWKRWLFCLLGFVLARFAVQWLTQPPREDRTRSTPEAGYAP